MQRHLYFISFLLFCLIPTAAFAQKQTNVWYFGHNSGLDFNQSPPRLLNNSAMRASEGVATIADANGNLLFYTNGVSIWNKNHGIMTNGTDLAGHISSRQGVIIVPQPGSKTLYFVFTSDAMETKWAKGLRYSVVDIALQGGLGEVVRKNVLLQPLAEENLTATGSCNCSKGSDQYWLAADRQDRPGYLFAYQITKSGVQTQAVASFLPGVSSITYLKFSPAGDKIAFNGLNDMDQAIIGVADFNQTSGAATNLKLFPAGRKDDYHRAMEFSGNGQVLYFTGWSPGIIIQYDLSQPTSDKVMASALMLTEPKYGYMNGPQLASNGKIYIATSTGPQTGSIFVIEQPNLLGTASLFKPYAIPSPGGLMLANFVSSFLYQNDTLNINADAGLDQQVCGTAATRLGGKGSQTITYRWRPSAFLSDSTASNPVFQYPKEIEKETVLQYVLLAADGPCRRLDTVRITVRPLPKVSISGSRSVCPGVEGVIYQLTPTAGQTYQWQVTGGAITQGQRTAVIRVNWGPTNAAAGVEVTPTSAQGCAGPTVRLPVRINNELDTETPQGPASVCRNQASGNVYQVTNTTGSVYTWGLMGGSLTAGQGTAQVKVNWQETGPHRI